MAVIMEAFPKLSRELLVKTGYNSNMYHFSYTYHGEEYELNTNTADSSTSRTAVFQLSDKGCQWHPEQNNLIVKCRCVVNTPMFLFGENGVAAYDGGTLGVAVMWMLPDTSIRGVEKIGKINANTPAPAVIEGKLKFGRSQLRGTLILQTVLFLAEEGKPRGREIYQASRTGTVLGVLDETKVIIDGNGSIFPVQEKSAPGQPLWWASCKWEDPTEDLFNYDSFCIYLNTAHKDYSELKVNEGLKNSPLLMEIVCSAIQILIIKVLSDDVFGSVTINGCGIQMGSVSAVVNYFIHTYGWRYDRENPEGLATAIRTSMMQRL